LKGKQIERLEIYVNKLKRKVDNEHKKKTKLKAQGDLLKGVSIQDANQPQVTVDRKVEFEKELWGCLKDSHKRLGLVLQDIYFMDGILFKEYHIL
jgi:hypothetical protein